MNTPGARLQLIVVSADKGLAGSFNSNIIKAAGTFIIERPGQQIELVLVGRKARDFFRRRGFPVRSEHVGIFSRLDSAHARAIGETAIEDFTAGKVDGVFIVYNEFKSIMTQKVVVEQLLPIPRAGLCRRPRVGGTHGHQRGQQSRRRPRRPHRRGLRDRVPLRARPGDHLRGAAAARTSRSRSSTRCSNPPLPNTPRG